MRFRFIEIDDGPDDGEVVASACTFATTGCSGSEAVEEICSASTGEEIAISGDEVEDSRAMVLGGGQSVTELSGPLLLRRILLSGGSICAEVSASVSCLVCTCLSKPGAVLYFLSQ